MTNKTRYLLTASVFVLVVGVLISPYVLARLKPIPVALEPVVDDQTENSTTPELSDPNHLSIPSLGIEAPIKYVTEKSEKVYQEALHAGVVHYPGTALPGEFGNAYIFGHSSDYIWSPGEYKTVFAKLPQIEIGAVIQATNPEGQVFEYVVTETKVVGPRDLSVLDQGNNQAQLLTLQTSYPLGTALQRFIVVSTLKTD